MDRVWKSGKQSANTSGCGLFTTGFGLGQLILVLFSSLLLVPGDSVRGQGAPENNNPWQAVGQTAKRALASQIEIQPDNFLALSLSHAAVQTILRAAPKESGQSSAFSPAVLTLPMPDGTWQQFRFVESPVMAPELAAQYPEIKTYSGQNINDPATTVRFDLTPAGFHAQILSTEGAVYIDPYLRGNTNAYASYFKSDYHRAVDNFQCLTPAPDSKYQKSALASPLVNSGGVLRTYRLACAATGEYTQYHGGTVAAGLAAMATAMNRVSGIYEAELAIRLVLVANNSLLIYTNAATDPYTANNCSLLLSENQANLDKVIGNDNYDIGHVFSTSGGGLAGVGVVCVPGSKAFGETGIYPPTGDAFWVDYVAHEMGHQFGASHTFNSTNSGCGGGRSGSTAYEPGSGSTIMAYAGVCGTDNLQPHSDPYFHSSSVEQITAYVMTGSGSTCPLLSATANNAPMVSAGPNFVIPKSTPFTLTAAGSDSEGDLVTYSWEERDLGPCLSLTSLDNGSSPLFRSFAPTVDPARTFPRLSDILGNIKGAGETLPTTARTMNFRVVARDNRNGGGGMSASDMQITVVTNAGPFRVTSPNTAVTWSGFRTVTWNVAGTIGAPIFATQVNILLSTNGGLSFPFVLATNVPNSGSQTVLLPSIATSTARVKIQAASNIFFDISDMNFSIAVSSANLAMGETVSPGIVSAGANVVYTLRVTNSGPGVASDVVVTDALPSALAFKSANPSQGTCSLSNGVVVCVLGVVSNGATATITMTATAMTPGTTTNIASVRGSSSDPAGNNNMASAVLTINAVHNGPVLTAQLDRVLDGQGQLVVTNTASSYDIPALRLTYQLINPPPGASIDNDGIIRWSPTELASSGVYTFQTMVSDDGVPRRSATNSFRVTMEPALAKPSPLVIQSLTVSNGVAKISWPALPGLAYRLQYCDSLMGSEWHDLSPNIVAVDGQATATDAVGSVMQRFYRVWQLP